MPISGSRQMLASGLGFHGQLPFIFMGLPISLDGALLPLPPLPDLQGLQFGLHWPVNVNEVACHYYMDFFFFFTFSLLLWVSQDYCSLANSFVVLLLLSLDKLTALICRTVYSWNLLTLMSAVEETKANYISCWPSTLIPQSIHWSVNSLNGC